MHAKINKQRLTERLQDLAAIGKDPNGGITRLPYTGEYKEAEMKVRKWMIEAGMDVRLDAAGNLIGRMEGEKKNLPVILAGSHIDTVIQGGMFDGSLGVIGAIEAVQAIKESGIKLLHPVEVIVFIDEEGVRFNKGYFGSRAILGKIDESELNELYDKNGINRRNAMLASGLTPEKLGEVRRHNGDVKLFLELHIEQGKILEEKKASVGIVEGIAAPSWFQIKVVGNADHAGSTPMYLRKDALSGAASMITEIERIASDIDDITVATVGSIEVKPGATNTIPGEVTFTLDIRHIDRQLRSKAIEKIKKQIITIAQERGLHVDMINTLSLEPVLLPQKISEDLEKLAQKRDFSVVKMISGAGHDAMIMSELTDVGFIFVPSQDGISHHPDECTRFEDCADGVQLLTDAIIYFDL